MIHIQFLVRGNEILQALRHGLKEKKKKKQGIFPTWFTQISGCEALNLLTSANIFKIPNRQNACRRGRGWEKGPGGGVVEEVVVVRDKELREMKEHKGHSWDSSLVSLHFGLLHEPAGENKELICPIL